MSCKAWGCNLAVRRRQAAEEVWISSCRDWRPFSLSGPIGRWRRSVATTDQAGLGTCLPRSASSLPQVEGEAGRGGSRKIDHAPSAQWGGASRAVSAGRGLQGGADGEGRGLEDSDSPRTGQELPLLLPSASSRFQRFLTGDRTRPPCPPRRRLMGWVWSGRTMAVSAGGLGCAGEGPGSGFPGGSAGRVRGVAWDRTDPEEQPSCVAGVKVRARSLSSSGGGG